jgi:hypothetical protein
MELLLLKDPVRIGLRKRIQQKLIINNRICLGLAMTGLILAVLAVRSLGFGLIVNRANIISGVTLSLERIGIVRME